MTPEAAGGNPVTPWRRRDPMAQPPACHESNASDPASLSEIEVAQIAKALGHPARLHILEQFAEPRPRTVQDIVDACERAPSTVSEHLRILREAGLLIARRDGPRTWYCLRRSVIRQFLLAMEQLTKVRVSSAAAEPAAGASTHRWL